MAYQKRLCFKIRRCLTIGFTLIEFLIACAIGFIVIEGLINVQVSIAKTDKKINTLNNLNEREQLASLLLTKNIHLAGDASCASGQITNQTLAVTADNDHSFIIGRCLTYKNKLQFIQTVYFIDNTYRKNEKGQKIYALYQKKLGKRREELIPDVSDMNIVYGVSQNKNFQYLPASQIENWLCVSNVKVKLTLNSLNKKHVEWIEANLRERNLKTCTT